MALYWTIDSRAQLFTAVAAGEVSCSDAMNLLEVMAGAKALSYRKLFDGRGAISTMTPDEVLQVCAKIRSYHDQPGLGALVVVATPEQTVVCARLLGVLAAGDRPFKVFTSLQEARKWLG